jgi:glycine cleavage system regulatory protein
MNTSIVLTIIADDHPGIIKTVSSVLTNHDGSWTQSSMSSLAGQFAGILLVSVPTEKTAACLQELHGLESMGMHVVAHLSGGVPEEVEETHRYFLDLVGNDRAGIVHDITSVLASHKVNVHDLETVVESASMGGGEIFRVKASLEIPAAVDIDVLESELEEMANDLMVDFSLVK